MAPATTTTTTTCSKANDEQLVWFEFSVVGYLHIHSQLAGRNDTLALSKLRLVSAKAMTQSRFWQKQTDISYLSLNVHNMQLAIRLKSEYKRRCFCFV